MPAHRVCAGPWEEPVLNDCLACMHGCVFCVVCDFNRGNATAHREREAISGSSCIRFHKSQNWTPPPPPACLVVMVRLKTAVPG